MSEEQLDQLTLISNQFIDITTQYQALTDSARIQYDLMVQSHHARVTSRIGFAVQEITDLELEMAGEIENRVIEINNNSSECITTVERLLQDNLGVRGIELMNVARGLKEEISLLNDDVVNPVLKTLDNLVSQLEKETLSKFRETNAVTEIDSLHELLKLEVEIADSLFEVFVQEIFVDFIVFEILTSDINERLFPRLDSAIEDFRGDLTSAREALTLCI